MKKLILFVAAGLLTGSIIAQELPQPSPLSKTEQVVGLTDITIEYSRPSVKGRTIFGDLVPYGKVWRLGANACTKFTSSTDFKFGSADVKAGTYAMFAIPEKSGMWKVVLNTDTEQWGAGNYDEAKNVATVDAKAVAGNFHETFTIGFSNITNNSAVVVMMWDKTMVEVGVSVETGKMAMANIDAAIEKGEDLDKVYYRAASYYNKSLNDQKQALVYISKGLKVKDTHHLHFLRAQILMDQGKKADAMKEAETAHKLALEAESKGWADYIMENMEEWKK